MYTYYEGLRLDEDDKPTTSVERAHRVQFPLWVLLLALLMYPLATFLPPRLRSRLHRWRYRKDGLCPQCGYNLTGNVTGICPECGSPTLTEAGRPSETQDKE